MARSEATVDVVMRLESAALVRPGDRLVVASPVEMSMAEMHEMRERVATALPGVGLVIVDRCSGLAVYRPEDDAPAEAI